MASALHRRIYHNHDYNRDHNDQHPALGALHKPHLIVSASVIILNHTDHKKRWQKIIPMWKMMECRHFQLK